VLQKALQFPRKHNKAKCKLTARVSHGDAHAPITRRMIFWAGSEHLLPGYLEAFLGCAGGEHVRAIRELGMRLGSVYMIRNVRIVLRHEMMAKEMFEVK
jgi:hypothetical protein